MEEKDLRLSCPLFNMEQINYYSENGAMIKHVGMKYYENNGKLLFYVQYEVNEKYLELKDKWMNFKR